MGQHRQCASRDNVSRLISRPDYTTAAVVAMTARLEGKPKCLGWGGS